MRAVLLACLLLAVPRLAPALEHAPGSGPAAPALALPDLQGRMHRLSDYRGKVVLLNFWASWCAPCRAEMPSIERLRRTLRGEPFAVLAVNVDEDARAARRFVERTGIGFTVLVDPDARAAREWGTRALPTTFIIGPDGRVRFRHVGARDWSDSEARAAIEGLMLQAPPVQTAAAY